MEKPFILFYQRIAVESDLEPARIAYVEDRLDNDIPPAMQSGIWAVFIRRGPWGHLHGSRRRQAWPTRVSILSRSFFPARIGAHQGQADRTGTRVYDQGRPFRSRLLSHNMVLRSWMSAGPVPGPIKAIIPGRSCRCAAAHAALGRNPAGWLQSWGKRRCTGDAPQIAHSCAEVAARSQARRTCRFGTSGPRLLIARQYRHNARVAVHTSCAASHGLNHPDPMSGHLAVTALTA